MKFVKIFAVAAVLSMSFASCKTGHTGGPCPAYGSNNDMNQIPVENLAHTPTTTKVNI